MSRILKTTLVAVLLAALVPTARAADLEFDAADLPGMTEEDLERMMSRERTFGTRYSTLLTGSKVVPPTSSRGLGLFYARPSSDGETLHLSLWAAGLRNVVAAEIRLGAPGENGESVVTLFGPSDPGGGYFVGKLASGDVTADDLEGPLAGQSLIALLARLEAGTAYVQIATDDGEGGDNTGPGDLISGEIRGQAKRYGSPFPLPLARLQVIHNAADPGAALVDIWVNGERAINDFAFRDATPFLDLPAELELEIGVAGPDSQEPDDILITIPVTLAEGETYVAFANGLLDPNAFAANPDGRETGFGLLVKPMARESALDASKVEFFALHGATDAPTVDIIARNVGTLVPDAAYTDITDYLAVPATNYVLDVTPGDDNDLVVASFTADLTGLDGGAAAVFASGFLDPTANQGGPAFGLFAALPNGDVVPFPVFEDPMARVQIIHNAADPGAAVVDIWVNGERAINDFAFRDATPFLDLPAETELEIGVAGPDSEEPSDILIRIPVTLEDGETYVAFANGVLDPTAFAANPDHRETGFELLVKPMAREAALDASKVEFFALHGATDAPTVDIIARNVGTLVPDAAYTDITDYLAVPATKYILDVTPGDDNDLVVASFTADLTGLDGGAAAVFASGFLDPATNQGGPDFGLFAALPTGDVVPFPVYEGPMARLQVIHNAADPGAALVDIWVNGERAINDFAFRDATPFLDLPAETQLEIGVAGPDSEQPSDILIRIPVTLEEGGTYVAFANGVLDPTAFAANPDGRETGFELLLQPTAREAAEDATKFEFFVLHGATDAPTVAVIARDVGTLVPSAAYTDITGYIPVPAARYLLDIALVEDDDDGGRGEDLEVVATFVADLAGLDGKTAAVFASGFLDPTANQNGQAFGLFAALANGEVVELPAKTMTASRSLGQLGDGGNGGDSLGRGALNAGPAAAVEFEVSQNLPNPVRTATTIRFAIPNRSEVRVSIHDVTGRRVGDISPGTLAAGRHELRFDASRLASGVYWYRLQAGSDVETRKMIVTR